MYANNLSMAQTIPQGIVYNNTLRAYTYGYPMDTIINMSEFNNLQRLLMHVRDTYCDGSAAKLSRDIGKADTYVNRLFYPATKRGYKGIGLEIMNACTKAFSLQPGFWETDASTLLATQHPVSISQTIERNDINHLGSDSYFGWPFGDRIKPWQYNLLTDELKSDVEDYIFLKLKKLNREHSPQQPPPENNERTGTYE